MQTAGQYAQISTSSGSYLPQPDSRHFIQQNEEAYYANQGADTVHASQQSRHQKRHNGHIGSTNSAIPQQNYYTSQSSGQSRHDSPRAQQAIPMTTDYPPSSMTTTLPVHSRNRSAPPDQYDGPPTIPTRASSQQQGLPQPPSAAPSEERVTASRYARQNAGTGQNYTGQNQNYGGKYSEPARERARDDTATAAVTAAHTRRKGPSSPEGLHRATSTREPRQQSAIASQTRSEATMVSTTAPTSLVRENSEVINRLVVSDPEVDAERIQERVAEAQPAPIGNDVTPATGLGLVGSEGVDDGGRGAQRRQEFPKTTSRRKDVQFGEYMLGQTLGEGEFGKVKLGWKRDGSSQVAIKLIRRETVATNPSRLPKIYREISILRDLAHPNIVRLHEMVETERHIGIILEYASGGELFDYILNNRYLKDPAARRLFAQLVSGVGYLHKKGIVHRDLKLENLLLDQNKNIIITDFGFANTFNPADELTDEIEYNLGNKEFVRKYRLDRQDERGMRKGDLMQTSCGSPCYAAPELVVSDSLYTGRKVDVWSCGVILVSTSASAVTVY
jgi:protein-serine/threonine kinase